MSATRIRWSLVRGDSGKNSPAFACTRSSELHCKDLKPWPSGRDTFYSQVGYAKLVELRARDLTRGSIHDGMGVGTMTNRHLVFRLAVGAAMFIAVLLLRALVKTVDPSRGSRCARRTRQRRRRSPR